MSFENVPLESERDAAMGKKLGSPRPWTAVPTSTELVGLREKCRAVQKGTGRLTSDERDRLLAALYLAQS